MLKSVIAAAAFSALLATPVLADSKLKGVDIKPMTGQFVGGPRIVVEYRNGKLALAEAPVMVAVRTGGYMDNTSKKYTIFRGDIVVQNIWGKGTAYSLMPRNLQNGDGVRSIKDNRTLYLNKANLGPVAKQALDTCAAHTKAEVGYYPVSIPLGLYVAGGKEYFGGHEDIVAREAHTEIAGDIMCPAKPQRTAVPEKQPERAKIPARVKSVNLAIVNGIGEACPRPVFLVATFETDRAGAIDVILRRNDGATDIRTIQAVKKNGKFIAKYERTYQIKDDTRRKYMIEVDGQAKASAWKPMTVNCDGGFGAGDKRTLKVNR